MLQEKVEAYRNGTYEQYLIKKFNALNKEIEIWGKEIPKQPVHPMTGRDKNIWYYCSSFLIII